MNAKPDEHLDQWVRQTLDRLPDTPPPGSSFNADRLWGQLQPALQPPRRRSGVAWWAVAACLTGLSLAGWFWLTQQPTGSGPAVVSSRHNVVPNVTGQASHPSNQSWVAKQTPRTLIKRPKTTAQRPSVTPVTPAINLPSPASEGTDQVAQRPDLLPAVEPEVAVSVPTMPTKTTLVTATPKRRFSVVHINELTAEEEARPKIYRTENVVRLGTGTRQAPSEKDLTPLITIPLTKKTNH